MVTPIIQKGAAFIYNYQAVTSESESKVRVFSPFPQPPSVDLSAASSLIDILSNIKEHFGTLPYVQALVSNEACPVAVSTCQYRADGLKRSNQYSIKLIEDQHAAIHADHNEVLQVT